MNYRGPSLIIAAPLWLMASYGSELHARYGLADLLVRPSEVPRMADHSAPDPCGSPQAISRFNPAYARAPMARFRLEVWAHPGSGRGKGRPSRFARRSACYL